MLEVSYYARITLYSGQVVQLHTPHLYSILGEALAYEEFGIYSIVVLKCRKDISDGKAG